MLIRVLFMQRKENYEGEFGPEVIAAVDEYVLEENPEHWENEVKIAKATNKDVSAGFAEVSIALDGDAVRKLCLDQHTIKGEIRS